MMLQQPIHRIALLLLFLHLLWMNKSNSYPLSSSFCDSSFDCGNGVNIRYPFWNLENATSSHLYCGYPGFGLSCSQLGKSPSSKVGEPCFNTSNNYYYVTSIDYTSETFTVVDTDLVGEECPRPTQNVSFSSIPNIYYTQSDLNLTFFFNCTTPPPENSQSSLLPCLTSGTNQSYVLMDGNILDGLDWHLYCEATVVVPAKNTSSALTSDYANVLQSGFELNWGREKRCTECEDSRGRCGYNVMVDKSLCICSGDVYMDGSTCLRGGSTLNFGSKLAIAIVSSFIFVITLAAIFLSFWKKRKRRIQNYDAFLRNYGSLAPKRYSYSNIKKITNSFQEKLGQGGYGSVFKGKLPDGRSVAVKVLNASKDNGEEFINEVASISRTSHVHIVTLFGFCFDGSKRALIYEFMSNGSLEKFICNKKSLKPCPHLGWDKLYQIAIGIAKGLEYLHGGCKTRIVHFDIKPHNILLDEDFCPKISDFGLAKLCLTKDSIMSMTHLRGTIGYIAPEVFSRNFGGVSHKSDVYSYGMMVLEMVGGRKNFDKGADHTSEVYFPDWIYEHIGQSEHLKLNLVLEENEEEIVKKMVLVGLWCIQMDPTNRPSIKKVVDMLEGNLESLPIPPKPFLSSPSRELVDSFTSSIS